jgi:hypothetical protein
MIPEFQGNRPFFQPLHMKDMMDAKKSITSLLAIHHMKPLKSTKNL